MTETPATRELTVTFDNLDPAQHVVQSWSLQRNVTKVRVDMVQRPHDRVRIRVVVSGRRTSLRLDGTIEDLGVADDCIGTTRMWPNNAYPVWLQALIDQAVAGFETMIEDQP